MSFDAAMSRKLLAQIHAASSDVDDEARAHVQARLELYSRILLWAFVAVRVLEALLYRVYPEITPQLYSYIVALGIAGLVAMFVCWRGALRRRTLSLRALRIIDLLYTLSSGIVFGATALLAHERPEVAFICLVYACCVVFTRALVLPSSGRWTAAVSACGLAPLVIAAAVLAATTPQELPGAVFVSGALLFCVLALMIAIAGSRLIYGLRRRTRANIRLGQYTLDRKIGEGSMGVVFRARHALLRRPTAVKVLHPKVGPEGIMRLEREVQQMSQLTHPNSVAVYDYGYTPGGVFYYAMEYLDGIDLERLVERDGPQPPGRVIDILVQACGALHEAHARGLVHGDIKPANIILCERGGMPDVVKVVDYGLAVTNPAAAHPAADIHGLGVVGTFLCSARTLVEGPTAIDGAPELDAILTRCLARDPAQRPNSAEQLASELRRAGNFGWDVASARAWWAGLRASPRDVPTPAPSMTITVDITRVNNG